MRLNFDFLECYPKSMSKSVCEDLIQWFEERLDLQTPGYISKGGTDRQIDLKVKDSIDIGLDFSSGEDLYINQQVFSVVASGLEKYKKKYSHINDLESWSICAGWNIQKYMNKGGYFNLHSEHCSSYPKRMLVWMLYLNDAKCGTEFPYQGTTLKAKEGSLAIWPAGWTHPHKGVTPNKGVKYIATGWFGYNNL